MDSEMSFRYAERKDVALILCFIKELADYEKMQDEVVADEKKLEEWIFDTVTLLETVRELRALGVAVYFEEQNMPAAICSARFDWSGTIISARRKPWKS